MTCSLLRTDIDPCDKYAAFACDRWLQIRLELIGISVMLSIALVVVLLRWPADPGESAPSRCCCVIMLRHAFSGIINRYL